jgi:hypothetical protein
MADENKFVPGTLVKVLKGAFAKQVGVVLDVNKAADARGNLLPATRTGYYWVELTLNGCLFPAHLFRDEIDPFKERRTSRRPPKNGASG